MNDLQFSEEFARYLVDHDLITAEQAVVALDLVRAGTPPIGRLALKRGWLDMKQVFAVLSEQAESGLRFGEQAIFMGCLERDQLETLLAEQREVRPGLCAVLYEQGTLTKRALQQHRRSFLKTLESALV